MICLRNKNFRPTFGVRLISACSLFLETKLDQTDTRVLIVLSVIRIKVVTMEMKPQPAKKVVQRKKASKVKRFMFWKGVGHSGRFFYISHHPSSSNAQINYFSSAKKKRRTSKLSAIEMLER